MATSGSSNYNQTRNEIIQDALALIGVYGVGRTISAEDMAFSSNMLNKMVKTYQADALHLWAKEEGYLFIANGTGQYTLSSDSTSARACFRSDAVIVELTAAAASSATTLALVSTGMTVGDHIGITLDDNTTHWTTIATIPNAASVTIILALASAASSGNSVYTFTSRVGKPLRPDQQTSRDNQNPRGNGGIQVSTATAARPTTRARSDFRPTTRIQSSTGESKWYR